MGYPLRRMGLRWHEWADRDHHPELKGAVERDAHRPHSEVVAYIRGNRPRTEARSWEAARWWAEHRHLLLLALMGREASISQLARSLEISTRMIYTFLDEWGLHYMTFPQRATVEAPSGRVYEAVVDYDPERGYVARIDGAGETPARWAYGWRLTHEPVRYYPMRVALEAYRLTHDPGMTATPLALELALLAHEMGFRVPVSDPRIPEPVLVRVVGEDGLRRALDRLNTCGCVFWDPVQGCLLQPGRSGPCEDRIPLGG